MDLSNQLLDPKFAGEFIGASCGTILGHLVGGIPKALIGGFVGTEYGGILGEFSQKYVSPEFLDRLAGRALGNVIGHFVVHFSFSVVRRIYVFYVTFNGLANIFKIKNYPIARLHGSLIASAMAIAAGIDYGGSFAAGIGGLFGLSGGDLFSSILANILPTRGDQEVIAGYIGGTLAGVVAALVGTAVTKKFDQTFNSNIL